MEILNEDFKSVNYRINVKSSNLKSLGYNIKQKILHIEFNSGAIYEYKLVDKKHYDEIIKNKDNSNFSVGKYFAENIRFKYNYVKLK